jgi:hypothetical protein
MRLRALRTGVRWQSASDDDGETWSAPRVLDFGFGSSCEGSVVRVPGSRWLLLSHAGRVGGRANRWNLTVWRSADSGATWRAAWQIEPLNATQLPLLHTAYSTLVVLPAAAELPRAVASERLAGAPAGAAGARAPAVRVGIAYERGPMPGSHVTPSKCGEYATIRWRTFEPNVV